MDEDAWLGLLNTMRVDGTLMPATSAQLDAYEEHSKVKLPASYRAFCKVFGPGTLGSWYDFASPCYSGLDTHRWELSGLNEYIRNGIEWEEYAEDVEQFRRSIIFGKDEATGTFLFDPAIVTNPDTNEYAIFAVWRDFTTERVCDSFDEFISICLHRGSRILYDESPPLTYRAMYQARSTWERR